MIGQTKHLNTPRLVADAAGTTVWRWDQAEPFGANPSNDDPDGNSVVFDLPLRLPGQRYDKETALHYNYFRDYDATIGRYAEGDPLGLRGSISAYAYVDADPLSYLDVLGLKREKRHKFEIWLTTVKAGPWGRPTSKRQLTDRWIIFANMPDCFVLLDVREEKSVIDTILKGDPSFPISGKGKPINMVTRDLFHTEWIWGPRKGDSCCGKESFSDFTYEKDPFNLMTTIKNVIDFFAGVEVPGEETLGKGGKQ